MSCCQEQDFIYSDGLGLFVCVRCGTIDKQRQKEVAEFVPNISFSSKTVIPYSAKFRHLHRLQKWENYDYYEVRDYKLQLQFNDYPLDKDLNRVSQIKFFDEYKNIKIRGNIKLGLVCYAIYSAHLDLKRTVDIDDWFKFLKITSKHYNNANKKLYGNKLFYPDNINKYLKIIEYKVDKNFLIRTYNEFLIKDDYKYNTKTILSSLIYIELEKTKEIPNEFFKLFKISKSSIQKIKKKLIIEK